MGKYEKKEHWFIRLRKWFVYLVTDFLGEVLFLFALYIIGFSLLALFGIKECRDEWALIVGTLAVLLGIILSSALASIARRKKEQDYLADNFSCGDAVEELDKMVADYNAIPESSVMTKWNKFWECHSAICKLHTEGKLFTYAGDFQLEYLKTLMENDGPEYSAKIVLGASHTDFYVIGVCVRGTPLLEKIEPGSDDAAELITYLYGELEPHSDDY